MKILITGGAGFIGSHLAKSLVDKDLEVVVLDDLSTGSIQNLSINSRIKFIKGDVNDAETVESIFAAEDLTTVFHFAALVGVKKTLDSPLGVLADVRGLQNIFEFSVRYGIRHVLFSSSSEVYGEPVEHPQIESRTPLNARLPYAVVKNLGECFCRAYSAEAGLTYTVLRFFNTVGKNQSANFVLSNFIRKALNNEDLIINGDGLQTRSFCHVTDTVDTCVAAMRSNLAVNTTLNVGSDIEVRIGDLAADVIKRIPGCRSKLIYGPPLLEGDMSRRCPNIEKMVRILGRRPLGYSDLLDRTIREFLD